MRIQRRADGPVRKNRVGFRADGTVRAPASHSALRTPHSAFRGAFTLIELIVSSALMAIIVTAGYLCLSACLSSQRVLEPRLEVIQNARVALALIAADLRAACPLSRESEFIGMPRKLGDTQADNLDFATHNYTPRRPNEGDYCQVSLYVEKDPVSGEFVLRRRRNPTIGLDPLAGGRREELARGLRGFQLEYYDGFEWFDSWGDADGRNKQEFSNRLRTNLSGMPEAVRVTLLLDPSPRAKAARSGDDEKPEPPLVFQTVVRLNLSAASSGGTASGSSGSGQPAAQPDGGNP